MDKTININLGGTLFQIDEETYRMLHDYLQEIDARFRNVPGGYETIEDIEFRIAEIFQSQKGPDGVITKENFEAMISIIGKPEDFGQSENENITPPYSSGRKKLFRNPDDTIIGGVCGGIAAYIGTDPLWIRILFILSAMFFGIGFFIYLALWIALPSAQTDARKKEMYGNAYYSSTRQNRQPGNYTSIPGAGNVINEVFMAFGKVFFIVLRIILIIIGTALVLTGFLAILSFVMVFLFHYPGSFSTNIEGVNLSYISDFLNFIVSPSVVPWITTLAGVIIIFPLLALTYWGVKMIFWFKARDGVFSLIALVIWVMSIAALAIVLFNEGVGYAETAKTSSSITLYKTYDTLYIKPIKRIADLNYDHEIAVPHKNYYVYIAEEKKEVFIPAYFRIQPSENNNVMMEVTKQSNGRTRSDGLQKAEALQYNFSQSGDTLFFDEYFTYAPGNKWSFDNVGVTLHIPVGTVVYMGIDTKNISYPHPGHYNETGTENYDKDDRFRKLTKEGFIHSDAKQK